MHHLVSRHALVLVLLSASLPGVAVAQVTTNQGALDALGPSSHAKAAASHARTSRPATHPSGRHVQTHASSRKPAHPPAQPPATGPRPPAATIPAAPPPPPVFRVPVITVPLHPPAPPPPVPVVQTAIGTVTPIDGGTRIGFGGGSSDLNPATMQALHDFATRLKATPDSRAILDAAAVGTSDDPSTPRRLALSRGLAARAVLINDGIPSTRIYVRMAPNAAAGSDHVDLRTEANDAAPVSPDTTTPPAASEPTKP
jgi:outer membrane protein OmpA-like peptidoglycan-associated protein